MSSLSCVLFPDCRQLGTPACELKYMMTLTPMSPPNDTCYTTRRFCAQRLPQKVSDFFSTSQFANFALCRLYYYYFFFFDSAPFLVIGLGFGYGLTALTGFGTVMKFGPSCRATMNIGFIWQTSQHTSCSPSLLSLSS